MNIEEMRKMDVAALRKQVAAMKKELFELKLSVGSDLTDSKFFFKTIIYFSPQEAKNQAGIP